MLPSTNELLRQLGERLRLARLRRRLSIKRVAERAGMAPMTLLSVERGGSGVTIGAYMAVMQVLGSERDIDLLMQTDSLGHALQDARLPARRTRARTPSRPPEREAASADTVVAPSPSAAESPQRGMRPSGAGPADPDHGPASTPELRDTSAKAAAGTTDLAMSTEEMRRFGEQSGFTTSHDLANLLDAGPFARSKKR